MTTELQLTLRETEVLQLLARGCTYVQIGNCLGVSLHTVESHIKNLYRKLNVHSARAAVWRAAELQEGEKVPDTFSDHWSPVTGHAFLR
jgi:DNA-binding CsgD family transcriptional regulator